MRGILKTLFAASFAVAATACALLASFGAESEARRAARVTLAAYETMQEAVLIYGRLPVCDAEAGAIRLCKDRETWARIKTVEKAASEAIGAAEPVLNGTQADAGEIAAALGALENLKQAVASAHLKLSGGTP